MFKANKVGTTVGKTTYGAGIGTALFQQPLIDNGLVAIPNRASYNPHSGTWDAENEGIHPDIDVEIMPADWRAGRDPQLEAAVKAALQAIQTYRGPVLRKPIPPVHAGGRKPKGG
jgi:tricorn protease